MLSLKKSVKRVAIAAAFSTIATMAQAHEARVVNDGYVISDQTGQVVRDSFGWCWHTSSWTPEKATVIGCDGYTGEKVVAVVSPPPVAHVRRFALKTDTLFGFDKATLRAEGKHAIDKLFDELKDLDPKEGKVLVVGYTDRIGSDKYNQGLSERRAHAVRSYLVAKGMPADKIEAEGRGKSHPVTGDTCKGTKKTKALIACLSPDRRVEVEVVGKRVVIETPNAANDLPPSEVHSR
jgi:outer membrane protein OmpA-like peptidoglycan-associated protein